ncbi:MAG: ABC transporter permease, partial [Deltaproteobacteria bacterium]|nr:ABC transporter permease [Deltaproteobacteria bacterium]
MRHYRRRDMEPRKITRQEAQRLLRRLVALARPEWRSIAVGTLFLLVGSVMGLAYPQAIRVIVDKALAPEGLALIDKAAFVMLGLFTVQAVAIAIRHYVFTVSGERVVTRLREQLYRAIIAQEIAFFDERRTGELVSRLASDTTVLQNTVSVNISVALRNAAAAMGGIALLLYSSPRLSVLILAVVPPLVAGTLVFGRRIRRLSRELHDELAKAGEVAEETIAGIR